MHGVCPHSLEASPGGSSILFYLWYFLCVFSFFWVGSSSRPYHPDSYSVLPFLPPPWCRHVLTEPFSSNAQAFHWSFNACHSVCPSLPSIHRLLITSLWPLVSLRGNLIFCHLWGDPSYSLDVFLQPRMVAPFLPNPCSFAFASPLCLPPFLVSVTIRWSLTIKQV